MKVPMRAVSLGWIFVTAVWGGAYGLRGYRFESLDGLLRLIFFWCCFTASQVLMWSLLPRIKGGKWNTPQVRVEAAQRTVLGTLMAASALLSYIVYRLAAADGDWAGNWNNAVIGMALGTGVGGLTYLMLSRLRLFHWVDQFPDPAT